MILYKARESQDRVIFDPSAMIWTFLEEAYQMKLHTDYQRPWLSDFRVEEF